MKKRFCKTVSMLLAAALVATVAVPTEAAKKAPKMASAKVTVKVGAKKTIKVKNNAKKATWSIKSGKKNIKLSSKKKSSVVVKGVKKGNAVVLAKVDGKKLTCKVVVKDAQVTPEIPVATETPAAQAPTQAPVATDTPAPTATPVSYEVKDVVVTGDDLEAAGFNSTFNGAAARVLFVSDSEEGPEVSVLEKRFDLKYFDEAIVELEYDFADDDTSSFNGGKVSIASDLEGVTGYADGDKLKYISGADTTEVTLDISDLEGPVAGFNVQAWDANNDYATPECLAGIKIKKITFVAAPGQEYPKN